MRAEALLLKRALRCEMSPAYGSGNRALAQRRSSDGLAIGINLDNQFREQENAG
jgi:hypothetical protein